MLAVKVIQEQNIEVIGLNFKSQFFGLTDVEKYERQLNIKIKTIDITKPYLQILLHPKHGYGKNANPCIDCHAYMIERAVEIMHKMGAKFVFTGEVLNERPFSQNFKSLSIVGAQGGDEGYLVRPLSAKFLKKSIPEQTGILDRDKLYAISGRSRKKQIELAEKYNIRDFPQPGGGCVLTDPSFSKRVFSLKRAGVTDLRQYMLIKIGRHIWLDDSVKIVVTRHKEDDDALGALLRSSDTVYEFPEIPGPRAAAFSYKRGRHFPDDVISRILAGYVGKKQKPPFVINKKRGRKIVRTYSIDKNIESSETAGLYKWKE